MKKSVVYLIFTITLILGTFITTDTVLANGKLVSVDDEGSESYMKVNYDGDEYKLYQSGELVETNKNGEFVVNNEEEIQKYKIGVFKNKDLKKVIKVTANNNNKDSKTSTLANQSKEKAMQAGVKNGNIQTSISDDQVTLSWDDLPDTDGKYEVYKGNTKIGTTPNNEFIDKNVKTGQRYQYEVLAKNEVSQKRKDKIDKQIQEKNLDLDDKQKQSLYYTRGAFNTSVTIPQTTSSYLTQQDDIFGNPIQQEKNETSKAMDYPGIPGSEEWKNYIFRYTTFIPYTSVTDPYHPTKYLEGDDRGFGYFKNSYRTRADVKTNFTDFNGVNPSITGDPSTGVSHRCENSNCNGTPVDTDQASTNGIEIIKDKVSSSKLQWRVKHDVGIPFGSLYPNINYFYRATVTDSPSIHIEGAHDRAPNHELYIAAQNSDDTMQIMNYEVKNKLYFGFLIPATPQKYFDFTV